MAIAEMSRMTLVALKSDKNALLDAMQRTGAVQITCSGGYALAEKGSVSPDVSDVNAEIDRIETGLDRIALELENTPPGMQKEKVVKDGIGVSVDEFFAVGDNVQSYRELLESAEQIALRRRQNSADIAATENEKATFSDYVALQDSFAAFADTKSACVFLGITPFDKTKLLEDELAQNAAVTVKVAGAARRGNVVAVVCYKTEKEFVLSTLAACGFVRCQISEDVRPSDKIAELDNRLENLKKESERISADANAFAPNTGKLKLYSDYLQFIKEKMMADENIDNTASSFVLSAYVPTEAVNRVEEAVRGVTGACYVDFSVVKRSEFAPTLMKNKRVVKDFEAVTNMYTAPSYGALDPNGVMGIFFSLFMGVIMADVGYGLMMLIGGLLFAKKQREGTSIYRMAKVFAYGGIFAILFGALLDSWLGMSLLRGLEGAYPSILPSNIAASYKAFYLAYLDPIVARSSIMGIDVPSMLLWCLGLGVLHIAVSLFMNAAQHFGRKEIVSGIFGGMVWGFTLLAFIAWIFCLAAGIADVANYAMYATIALAVVGILTAGIKEKGAGKVTKVFSSLYGLINYVSDILSYARLYGLMLSGAQIASIFTNTLAIQMLFPTGVAGVIFGVVVIIIGNVFNVAMSLLGGFIHDSRLQYVEFFGRFYEGEGELFQPFGCVYEHIYFKN